MGEGPGSFVHQEYPKWVNGKVARNEQEEAAILGKATTSPELPVEAKVKAKTKVEEIKSVEPSGGFNEAHILDSVRALREVGKNWYFIAGALNASGLVKSDGKPWHHIALLKWVEARQKHEQEPECETGLDRSIERWKNHPKNSDEQDNWG
jgi:hypothetical protein